MYRIILLFALICFPFKLVAMPSYVRVVVVQREHVWLSDLFPHAQMNSHIILGSAPQPGKEYVVGPRQLQEIASRYNVLLLHAPSVGVLVKSLGMKIGPKDAARAMELASPKFHLPPHSRITLDEFKPVLIRSSNPIKISVQALDYQGETGKITATLSIYADNGEPFSIFVSGDLMQLKQVIYAKDMLYKGKVINRNDVYVELLPKAEDKKGLFSNIDQVLGRVVLASIPAGQPVLSELVKQPVLVEKGGAVVLSVGIPGLQVQVNGIALAGGELGSEIRVLNPVSHDIILARITAPGAAKAEIGTSPTSQPGFNSGYLNKSFHYARNYSS